MLRAENDTKCDIKTVFTKSVRKRDIKWVRPLYFHARPMPDTS